MSLVKVYNKDDFVENEDFYSLSNNEIASKMMVRKNLIFGGNDIGIGNNGVILSTEGCNNEEEFLAKNAHLFEKLKTVSVEIDDNQQEDIQFNQLEDNSNKIDDASVINTTVDVDNDSLISELKIRKDQLKFFDYVLKNLSESDEKYQRISKAKDKVSARIDEINNYFNSIIASNGVEDINVDNAHVCFIQSITNAALELLEKAKRLDLNSGLDIASNFNINNEYVNSVSSNKLR